MCMVRFLSFHPMVLGRGCTGWEVTWLLGRQAGMGICSRKDYCKHLVRQAVAKSWLLCSAPGEMSGKSGEVMNLILLQQLSIRENATGGFLWKDDSTFCRCHTRVKQQQQAGGTKVPL